MKINSEGEKKLVSLKNKKDFNYLRDSIMTRHILYNLIKNALKAIKEANKGKITIEIVPSNVSNKIIFTNTATGISSDFLPKLFDRFTSKSLSTGGTGLGLAFCKMVMKSYGGDITCDSKEGEFTKFILSFPAIK